MQTAAVILAVVAGGWDRAFSGAEAAVGSGERAK